MANKTIVQVPVKKTELKDLHLYMTSGTPTWGALYVPEDDTGAPIGEPRSLSGAVTDAADLFAWVDRIIVPAINAQEGT